MVFSQEIRKRPTNGNTLSMTLAHVKGPQDSEKKSPSSCEPPSMSQLDGRGFPERKVEEPENL